MRRGCRGCKRTPKTFDLLKIWAIPENPGKIYENVRKIPKNLGKLPESARKNGAQRCLLL